MTIEQITILANAIESFGSNIGLGLGVIGAGIMLGKIFE